MASLLVAGAGEWREKRRGRGEEGRRGEEGEEGKGVLK